MQRIWKLLIIIGLVFSSLSVSQEIIGTDLIGTVKADNPYSGNTTNITEMTVEDLAALIVTIIGSTDIATDIGGLEGILNDLSDDVSDMNSSVHGSLFELNESINNTIWSVVGMLNETIRSAVISINENTSIFLFNETESNITFSEYIYSMFNVSDMNLSVSVEDVTFEGLNESTIMSYLIRLEEGIGYHNASTTLYDDMTNLYEFSFNSLCDLNGNYILRDPDGKSSFVAVGELLITTLENQQTLQSTVVNQSNATRTVVRSESQGYKNFLESESEWIVKNSSSFWSMIGALGIFFLIAWVLFLKSRFGHLVDPGQHHEDERFPGRPTGLAALDPRKKGQSDEVPRCYADGETYSIHDPNCVSCRFEQDCIDAQIRMKEQRRQAENEREQRIIEEEYNVNPKVQLSEIQNALGTESNQPSMDGWD